MQMKPSRSAVVFFFFLMTLKNKDPYGARPLAWKARKASSNTNILFLIKKTLFYSYKVFIRYWIL